MFKHILASILFWTIIATITIEITVLNSRLYIAPPWVTLKFLLEGLLFYNLIGIIVSLIGWILNLIINKIRPAKIKGFRLWLFGSLNGGAAIYLSLFYHLNKTVQSQIAFLSPIGLVSNLGLLAGALIISGALFFILNLIKEGWWKWLTASVVIIFLVVNLGLYIKAQTAGDNPKAKTSQLVREDTGIKLLLLGIDGATWRVLDPLIEKGEVPNFARLVETGFSDRLRTLLPTSSPVIWTTIVTGKSPGKHGIENVVFTVIPGMHNSVFCFPQLLGAELLAEIFVKEGVFYTVPVSSSIRQSKALWNIFSDYGLSTDVVNWWGTWPPERIKGNIISDHTSYFKQEARMNKGQLTVGEDFGYQNIAKTYPPELERELEQFNEISAQMNLEEANRFFKVDSAELEAINKEQNWDQFDYHNGIKFGFLVDKFNFLAGMQLLQKQDWDCFLLYLDQIDVMEHYFWMYYDDDPGLRKIYGDRPFEQVVPNAYKVIDGMLGDILKYVDENTVVILVSDHGFETFHLPDGAAVCDHSRAPDGVIIASGPYIQMRKQRISEYSVYDITPTILTLFGLPVGKDMDGKVMEDILDPQFLKDNPVAYIKSHNRGFIWRKYSTESTEDRTMLEKFRALGYIK